MNPENSMRIISNDHYVYSNQKSSRSFWMMMIHYGQPISILKTIVMCSPSQAPTKPTTWCHGNQLRLDLRSSFGQSAVKLFNSIVSQQGFLEERREWPPPCDRDDVGQWEWWINEQWFSGWPLLLTIICVDTSMIQLVGERNTLSYVDRQVAMMNHDVWYHVMMLLSRGLSHPIQTQPLVSISDHVMRT